MSTAVRSTNTPARRPARNRRRPGSNRPTDTQRPRPARVSALEQALTDSAALPLPEDATFATLGLPDRLVGALRRRGITEPTAVQARTLPDALAGRDVLGRAQTGAGKTLAFGLPMLVRLAEADTNTGAKAAPATPRRPRGLVLVPTRELAQQVKDALTPFAHTLGLRLASVYGGAGMQRQTEQLTRGVHLVVATPGRLEDHIRQGNVALGDVRVTVLDEADFMADLGFVPAVIRLLDQVAPGTQRMLFSATLDRGVEDLVHRYLSEPALHAVAAAAARVETMEHRLFAVRAEDKVRVATQIAGRSGGEGRTLLFVRTKHGADRLAKQLSRAGVRASAIHGGLRQNQRTRALGAFADGTGPVLVATDVAARGIHVDGVDLVVHYDPPADHKDYLHRSGRTARAGAAGTVLSLLLPDQVRAGEALQREIGTDAVAVTVQPDHPEVLAVASA
jgi:superfamily II DNA/RNA helicase